MTFQDPWEPCTVLSENVATDSVSAAPAVACREQLARSRNERHPPVSD